MSCGGSLKSKLDLLLHLKRVDDVVPGGVVRHLLDNLAGQFFRVGHGLIPLSLVLNDKALVRLAGSVPGFTDCVSAY
jgi:hypothetical protein